MIQKFTIAVLAILITTSCANKRNVLYMQNFKASSPTTIEQTYISTLQADDILSIQVSSKDNQGVSSFNPIVSTAMVGSDFIGGQQRFLHYVIRQDGSIEFPILGKIQLAGLTLTQAIELLKKDISKYVKDPIIIIEWLNFKYSVLGEVARPGQFTSKSERVTLLDALGNAGDLTIYGQRKNIMLIREVNGKRSHYLIDITKTDFINSEAFYLKQNDVVVVSPNNAKVQSSAFNQNATIYISIASVLLALTNIYLTTK